MSMLYHKDLGSMEFSATLALQERFVDLKRSRAAFDVLLFVEHPHVYTIGRGGNLNNVLAVQDLPLHRTSRGGDVTYHGPGQMVVYPIIDLRSKLRKHVHRYLRNLEGAAIQTLKDFHLEGRSRPPYTGIWIDDRKIAAIGIAVRRGITYHGLALNVNTDLSFFKRVVPCGLSWAEVTSMAKELGKEQSEERVKETFLQHFVHVFGYSHIKEISEMLDFQTAQKGSRCEVRDVR
jgi:lipoyl(octanoyl) transferase